MSLRNRRKQERREAILKAADDIFGKVGYGRATMDGIALGAGVGVATVYKYFGTKAHILEEIIRPDLEKCYAEAEKIIANPPADPGTAMSALIDQYKYVRDNWSNRKMLQSVSYTRLAGEEALDALVREADTRVQAQIRDLLLVLKGRGSIDPKLNLEDATAVIFSVFNQHFLMFVNYEDIDAGKMFSAMERRIIMLFSDWKKDSKS